jgi:predicted peroxiredoxin
VSSRAVFFVSSAGYEPAWQSVSMGLTAIAMGDEVTFVFAFDALRTLVTGRFGKPLTERERAESTRGDGLGAPGPAKMLEDARALGARLVACDTTVKLCGLTPSELEKTKKLDEVLGLPQIWRLTEGAKILNF